MGKSACFAFDGDISRPNEAKRFLISSSAPSCRTRSTPSALAQASAVRSSLVGPRPPVATITFALLERRSSTATILPSSSSTTQCSTTLKPRSVSCSPSHWALPLRSSPRVSSVPMQRTAAVMRGNGDSVCGVETNQGHMLMRRSMNRFSAFLGLILGVAAPVAAQPQPAQPQPAAAQPAASPLASLPIQRETLENGLRVVMTPDRNIPTVAIAVYYDVGSRNE